MKLDQYKEKPGKMLHQEMTSYIIFLSSLSSHPIPLLTPQSRKKKAREKDCRTIPLLPLQHADQGKKINS